MQRTPKAISEYIENGTGEKRQSKNRVECVKIDANESEYDCNKSISGEIPIIVKIAQKTPQFLGIVFVIVWWIPVTKTVNSHQCNSHLEWISAYESDDDFNSRPLFSSPSHSFQIHKVICAFEQKNRPAPQIARDIIFGVIT